MNFKSSFVLILSVAFVVGCGGGGNGVNTPPADTSFSFGNFSGRAAATNPPVSVSSQNAIGTAFTGTFSSLKVRDLNPSLQETRIIGTTDLFGPGKGLVSFAPDGTDPQKLTSPQTGWADAFPSSSVTGKVVFQRYTGTFPAVEIMNSDGSSLTQLVSLGASPYIDLAGDKVAYAPPNNTEVSVMTLATQAIVHIPLPTNWTVESLVLSPDGSMVYALLVSDGSATLSFTPSNGSDVFHVLHDFATAPAQDLAISPSGSELTVLVSGSPAYMVHVGAINGETTSPTNLPGNGASGVSYGADGNELVVGSLTAGVLGLYTYSSAAGFSRITSETATTQFPCWTPFIKDRTLISGGGGLLGTRACGVVFGQRVGGDTSSIVAFDVTTPSSVVMTAQNTGAQSPNLVFSADADSITKLAYVNTSNWRGIRAIGSGTTVLGANGALISLDGGSGQVVSILPFSGTRALGSHPTVTDNGSMRTFSGSFLAVYDKDGKNLAPSGASVVTLDTKTGALSVER